MHQPQVLAVHPLISHPGSRATPQHGRQHVLPMNSKIVFTTLPPDEDAWEMWDGPLNTIPQTSSDGLKKVEECPHWNDHTKFILGMCCEHVTLGTLFYESNKKVDFLLNEVAGVTIHLASNVSIVKIVSKVASC